MGVAEVPRDRPLFAVTGYFDPLHAAHVRRLRGFAHEGMRLVAIVTDPPEPYLPLRARCELVAALDCIDAVVAATDVEQALAALEPAGLVRDEAADAQRTRDLAAHVQRRQGAAV